MQTQLRFSRLPFLLGPFFCSNYFLNHFPKVFYLLVIPFSVVGIFFINNKPPFLFLEWKSRWEAGTTTNEIRSLGNGCLLCVVCFLSIKHWIATELFFQGREENLLLFPEKNISQTITLPISHQQIWTFYQAVDKEILSKIKLFLTTSVQKHLHDIVKKLGENTSQQYINKKL